MSPPRHSPSLDEPEHETPGRETPDRETPGRDEPDLAPGNRRTAISLFLLFHFFALAVAIT